MAFGRLQRTTGAQPMSDINMTPLIDVMLVLLVIFIITAPLMSSSLRLDLPKTTGATPTDAQKRDIFECNCKRVYNRAFRKDEAC